MAVNNPAGFPKKSNKPQLGSKIGEYQQHGKPCLVSILNENRNGENRGELTVLDAQNTEFSIAHNRVFQFPGRIPPQFAHRTQVVSYLRELGKESNKIKDNVSLEKAWEAFRNHSNEVSLEQIQKQLFPNQNLANFIAVRWALLADKFYFRRGKVGFSPRPGDSIEAIKEAVLADEKKKEVLNNWADQILAKSLEDQLVLILEKVAALGRKEDRYSEIEDLFEILESKEKSRTNPRIEDQAFELLVELGIFSRHQNLTPIKLERATHFTQEELESCEQINQSLDQILSDESREDHSRLETITIDGEDTRDFDDALSIEKVGADYKVGIHITDVSSFIKPDDLLWKSALKRGATVYTADQNFPMLPHTISEDLLSLVKDQLRAAISIFVTVDSNYNLLKSEIVKSKIKIQKRLSYNELDRDFELGTANSDLLFLCELSQRLEDSRITNGAKTLPKREMTPFIDERGDVSLEMLNEETPARKLVGEMMILANNTLANYAKNNDLPFIYRQQERSDSTIEENAKRINSGPAQEYALRGAMKRSVMTCNPGLHYGLALNCYTQCTSPIRRFVDLVNQYQINQFLSKRTPIQEESLNSMIEALESNLSEVTYIQRNRHRYWLLAYMQQSKFSKLTGTIVRTDGPKPLIELDGLYLISQFLPLKKQESRLGERINVKIDQISARLDRIKLIECDA